MPKRKSDERDPEKGKISGKLDTERTPVYDEMRKKQKAKKSKGT